MKRIYLLTIGAVVFLGAQFLLNCSSPLDSPTGAAPNPPGPTPPETVFINDTVFLSDSIYDTTTDTIYDTDTIVVIDTVNETTVDTIFDTTVIIDTIHDSTSDTLYDTIVFIDTFEVFDTLEVIDTFEIFDTLEVFDTLVIVDTFEVVDTLEVIDTLVVVDTFEIVDTLIETIFDTIFVPGPDTCEVEPQCVEFSRLHNKITWNLHNEDGLHNLEFTATFGEECFDELLFIHVNGQPYEWDPRVNPVFTLDADLRKDAKIMIHCQRDNKDNVEGATLIGSGHDDCDEDGDGELDCDGVDDNNSGNHQDCCNVEVCLKVTKL